MLLASNQAFVIVVLQAFTSSLSMDSIVDGEVSMAHLCPILILVWLIVPLVNRNSRSSSSPFNLITKTTMFLMLATTSLLYTFMGSDSSSFYVPPFFPEKLSDMDVTIGFLSSYFVVPLLCIAEDRVDYSNASSPAPANSANSYHKFARYSGFARYLFGALMCLKVAASPTNHISLDPFQLLIACIFTVTSVSSKMTAYLYKFTES